MTAFPFGSTVIDVDDLVPTLPIDQDINGWIEWSLPTAETSTAFGGLRAATEMAAIAADNGTLSSFGAPISEIPGVAAFGESTGGATQVRSSSSDFEIEPRSGRS